ncbi:MAG TPA: RNA polymerase sigma-70 factor [Mucilaginibacter sp.]|jgi:RNA polymerase sigma-70 factor (ECF subfamily)|nr:RNA polymerase sigma-70 factor [Mucilaginibacter sp.]
MTNYNACTDPQLLNLLRSGDRMAYTEIYDRYALVLLGHAYNKTRDREEAKDVVHEVFATLWAKRESLQIDYLAGYLFRSVRNIILNQITHQAVQEKFIRSMEQFAASNDIPDHLVREKQLTAIIEREIAALPPKMREVFVLSRKEHLSHKEIAEMLGISEQTVSKHVTNALKILRVKLGVVAYVLLLIHTH